MTDFENKPFKNAAIGYQRIEQWMREHTSVIKPIRQVDLQAVFINDTKVKNELQVISALKKFSEKGWISKIREGQHMLYWWKADSEVSQPKVMIESVKAIVPKIEQQTNRPEIIVNETSIVINHAKCKITVEFNG